MGRDDVVILRRAIEAWPMPLTLDNGVDISDAGRRALDAAQGLKDGHAGWADLAGLTRQVLTSANLDYGGQGDITVPSEPPWPSADQWLTLGFYVESLTDSRYRVRARAEVWVPPLGVDESVEMARCQVEAAYRDQSLRSVEPVDADPFWKYAHGYTSYRGEAQRQAARAAILAEPGRTLIISLPTGRGKTAVAWSRALMSKEGLTVVVVPTVVLAMDMERRTREYASAQRRRLSPIDRYAYVGDLDESTKDRMRQAVRSGQQRILYTSPEALVTGLATPVLQASQDGLLQQIVIDEAHLVDQWGSDFRPEYQVLAGLVNKAMTVADPDSRPRLLLLSATLAERHVKMLEDLFPGTIGEPDLIWGTQLRPEPAFFIHEAPSADKREQLVLDAMRSLPKPMILYTTRPEDAQMWLSKAKSAGLHRVGIVTGGSRSTEREQTVEDWRGTPQGDAVGGPTKLDIVIGTSAFGLGVDVSSVRTVIHACVPETVDRFYQEVGRAGRDGRATISLLATCPEDYVTAESLNSITLIGNERGWSRWTALRDHASTVGPNRYRVSLDTVPSHLPEGFGQSAKWNVRTLNLMARAGIIRLLFDYGNPGLDEETRIGCVDYEIVDGSKLTSDQWQESLDVARAQVWQSQASSLQSMKNILNQTACVGRILAAHYKANYKGGTLHVAPICRGCGVCRSDGHVPVGTSPVEPAPLLPEHGGWPDPLKSWRGSSPSLFIWSAVKPAPIDLLSTLARRGLNFFAGMPSAQGEQVQKAAAPIPVIVDSVDDEFPLLPSTLRPVVCLLESAISVPWSRDATYVVGAPDVSDPARPRWLLRDTMTSISADDLLKEL